MFWLNIIMLNRLHIAEDISDNDAISILSSWTDKPDKVSERAILKLYDWYVNRELHGFFKSNDVVYRGLLFNVSDMNEKYIPKLLAGKSIDLPNTRRYNSWTGDLSTAFFFGSPGIVLSSKLKSSMHINLVSVASYLKKRYLSNILVKNFIGSINAECEIISNLSCSNCDLSGIETINISNFDHKPFINITKELGYNIIGEFSDWRATFCIVKGKDIQLYKNWQDSEEDLRLKPTIDCEV